MSGRSPHNSLKLREIASVLLAWALGTVAAPGARAACVTAPEELRAAADVVHDGQRNVGLAARIWHDGEIVLVHDRGWSDLEHLVEVGPETRLGIASVTKLFTAVTLLRLAAAGEVDLDAPVQAYLPDFPVKPEGEITLRHLATHRSGIPHPQARTPEFLATHYESARDALEVFADEALVAVPGERRVYSSSNYNLLAAVIEAVRGRPFPEVVAQEVLEPLSLSGTRFDDVLAVIPHRASRYSFYHPWTYEESDRLYRVPTWDYSFNLGGGGLVSTASDLARFGEALLHPGLLAGAELGILYDDSWFGKLADDGGRYLSMSGSNPGVQTGLTVFPERSTVGVVLSNTWGVGARSADMVSLATALPLLCAGSAQGFEVLGAFEMRAGLLQRAVESLRRAAQLDPEEREELERKVDWVESLLRAEESPVSVPLERLLSYAGDYGPRRVWVEDRSLVYRRDGSEAHPLVPLSPDTLAFADDPMFRVRFRDEDRDGVAETAEVLSFTGQVEPTTRTEAAAPPPVAPVRNTLELSGRTWAATTENFKVERYLGREAVRLRSGTVYLPDLAFENGIIEVDVATTGHRSFVGVLFRAERGELPGYEQFYLRPHQSGRFDATQYTPYFGGIAAWQLYPEHNAAVEIPRETWIPLKLVVSGPRLEAYVGDTDAPTMVVERLRRGPGSGRLGLTSAFPAAGEERDLYPTAFSNFRLTPIAEPAAWPAEEPVPDPGVVAAWALSPAVPGTGDPVQTLDGELMVSPGWTVAGTEASGRLNLAAHRRFPEGAEMGQVLARVIVHSEKSQVKRLELGFSDRGSVFLNRRLLYAADNTYRSRSQRYLGVMTGRHDSLYLPLEEGENELIVAVTETFGGWGVVARFPDPNGIRLEARPPEEAR